MRKLVFSIAVCVGVAGTPAFSQQEPETAVSAYLDSLIAGDAERLGALIDGRLTTTSRHLLLDPEQYGAKLKAHYQGVTSAYRVVTKVDSKAKFHVTFTYPDNGEKNVILMLSQVDGRWKVVDEGLASE